MLFSLALTCLLYAAWTQPALGRNHTRSRRTWVPANFYPVHHAGITCDVTPSNLIIKLDYLSVSDCAYYCWLYQQCSFFTYASECRLYKTCYIIQASADPRLIPYVIDVDHGLKDTCDPGKKLPNPGPLANTVTECSQRCLDNKDCNLYSYKMQTAECELYSQCRYSRNSYWSFVVMVRVNGKDPTEDEPAVTPTPDPVFNGAELNVIAFEDTNGDDYMNNNENRINSLPVTIYSQANGVVVGKGMTRGDGMVTFDNLDVGRYTVTVDTSMLAGYETIGEVSNTVYVSGQESNLDLRVPFKVC